MALRQFQAALAKYQKAESLGLVPPMQLAMASEIGDTTDSQWLFIAPNDSMVHDGKTMRHMSRDKLQNIVANTNRLYAEYRRMADEKGVTPFRLPLVIEHNLSGPSYGTLEEFKVATRGGRDGIWARVDYTRSGKNLVTGKKYRFVSLRIVDSITTQQGKVFGPVIAEVSLTNYPRYQQLGEISDTAGMALSGLIQGKPMKNLLALFALLTSPDLQSEITQAQEALAGEEGDQQTPDDTPAKAEGEEKQDSEAMAASIVAALEAKLDEKIKPLSDEVKRLSSLNLSQRSTGAAPKQTTKALEQTEKFKQAIASGMSPAQAKLHASFND